MSDILTDLEKEIEGLTDKHLLVIGLGIFLLVATLRALFGVGA